MNQYNRPFSLLQPDTTSAGIKLIKSKGTAPYLPYHQSRMGAHNNLNMLCLHLLSP